MKIKLFNIAFFTFCSLSIFGQLQPGKSYFGKNDYIEYIAGNSPFIVSAPHGGSLKPTSIPDRNCAACTYAQDTNTDLLAKEISTSFFKQTGCYPHVIICHLHRLKMDANREIVEAALGNPAAEKAWTEFQSYIDSAKTQVLKQYTKGFYIDLHGHGHAIQRLELGYLLYDTELQLTDNQLNTSKYINVSSIKNLVSKNAQKLQHAELLRGVQAFGTLLQTQGFPSVPSQQDPFPLPNDPYFNGGYNTARHTSYKGGTIDGLQIESNFTGVRDNATNRKKFADSLSVTMRKYFGFHYFGSNFSYCKTNADDDLLTEKQGFVYPNPFDNKLTFNDLENEKIFMYDINGRLVKTFFITEKTQNETLPNLEKGVYFIKIKNKVERLVKM